MAQSSNVCSEPSNDASCAPERQSLLGTAVAAAPEASGSRLDQEYSQMELQQDHSSSDEASKKLEKGVSYGDAPLLGLFLYGLGSVFLSTMLVFAKFLGRRKFPVFEVLGVRSTIMMAIALISCASQRVNPLGRRRGLLTVRGLSGFAAIGSYFWAVQFLPLNDAMVLTYTSPIWVAILGPFLIVKEMPSNFIWVAMPLCAAGVCFIIQPSFLGFSTHTANQLGIFLALNQAFCSAIGKMCVRELRFTDAPNVPVFYLGAYSTLGAVIGCTVPKLWGVQNTFRLPNAPVEWWCLLGTGTMGYATQICTTFGLKYVKAAPAMAVSYLSLVWSILYEYYLFGDMPSIWSLTGAALICSTTLALGVFERSKKAHDDASSSQAGVAPQETGYVQLPPDSKS